MWRVTLNCSRNQTPWAARPPTLPQPLRFPAKAHARHAPTPEPAHPSRLLSLPCRRALGPAAGPTAVPSSRKSPGVNRRRLGTAALPRGRAAGRTLQPGSAAPPPRLLPSPPLPGARPAITWVLRRVAAVPPRARPRKLSARGADVLGLSTRCRRRRRRGSGTLPPTPQPSAAASAAVTSPPLIGRRKPRPTPEEPVSAQCKRESGRVCPSRPRSLWEM